VSTARRVWTFVVLQARAVPRLKSFGAVYIRTHFASLPTAAMARLLGIPVVLEVNGPHDDMFIAWPQLRVLGGLLTWAVRAQIRWADAVIAVTEGLRDWVRREVPGKGASVVPNGANTQLFRPDAVRPSSLPQDYVAFAGALARWQGIETMLAALDDRAWPESVSLAIAGSGELEGSVRRRSAEDRRLVYLGRIPYALVPGLLAGSLAGIVAKNALGGRESTGLAPLKMYEALACGVPAIVSDFPGQADLVREGGCGIVIPPESPADLAKAVAFLHDHPEKRLEMGKKGRALVESAHSWDARAAATAEVLERVLAKRGRRRRRT
jgi:glycosyltransferase involved in cell wall biosynthesis